MATASLFFLSYKLRILRNSIQHSAITVPKYKMDHPVPNNGTQQVNIPSLLLLTSNPLDSLLSMYFFFFLDHWLTILSLLYLVDVCNRYYAPPTKQEAVPGPSLLGGCIRAPRCNPHPGLPRSQLWPARSHFRHGWWPCPTPSRGP